MTLSVIQSNSASHLFDSTTSVSVAFAADNTANNGLAYFLHYDDATATASISDTAGNSLVQLDHFSPGNGGGFSWLVKKAVAGPNTVTVTFTAAQNFCRLIVFEVGDSGGSPNGFDQCSHALDGNGTGAASVAVLSMPATTVANSIVVGGVIGANGDPGTPNDLTLINSGGGYGFWYGDQVLTTLTTPTYTWTNSIGWLASGIALFTASAPSGAVFRRALSPIGTRTGSRQVHNRWRRRSDRGGLLMRDPLILPQAA